MPLDTLANVKTAIAVSGTADDAMLTHLQAVADSYIETHCGRSFVGGAFTELHPGGGGVLFLAHYPVTAVTEIRADPNREFGTDTVVDPDRYTVHAARGVVEYHDGAFVPLVFAWTVRADDFPDTVRVTYTVPTGAVPAVVCGAYAELIGHWYRRAKTDAAAGHLNVTETPSADGQTVYPWGQAAGYPVPAGVKELLAPFRVPAL
jgi:hypothetical protein